ncbi:MAG TPA: amidohydrolase family protein, partial [Thermoanaerobaculia bacterium]|nr:amidohydrolase family protein [Thermoanaerobaculia bacterium]
RPEIDERARRPEMAPEEEYHHIDVARQLKKLHDRGVSAQIGGHGQREGLAPHWEIWMFVQGGMTPHEALRAATLEGAQYIGLDKDLGSIEPGKLADLVILDANPLEDIRNTEKVGKVILNGRVYDGMTLDQEGNHPKKREPYFWQLQPGAYANPTATP